MGVFFDIDHLPKFLNTVLTIGTFDGVHRGHKAILKGVTDFADSTGGESVLVTFEPHPRKLLHPKESLGIITPLHKKLTLLSHAGIKHIVVVPFTDVFSHMSAHAYIEEFLVRRFSPQSIIIGYDHRFGHDRKGDIGLLRKDAGKYGYEVLEIPAQLIDDAAVSSTKIRNAIRDGRVDEAMHMLGRPFEMEAKVVEGRKLGRTIGFPTANLEPLSSDLVLPAIGVYAVFVRHQGKTHNGMMNIGTNPTVDADLKLKLEVHLMDFDGDIYGHQVEVQFVCKFRDEERFASLDALKAQLAADRETASRILADLDF